MNIAFRPAPALPRQLHRDPVSPFVPKAIACKRGNRTCTYESGECDRRGKCVDVETMAAAEPVEPVNLARLEVELTRNRLDEIAALTRKLTYAEMMEFAAGIWDMRKDDEALNDETLPTILHRWSTNR